MRVSSHQRMLPRTACSHTHTSPHPVLIKSHVLCLPMLAGRGIQPGTFGSASGNQRIGALLRRCFKPSETGRPHICKLSDVPAMLALSAPGERCSWCEDTLVCGTGETMGEGSRHSADRLAYNCCQERHR